MDKQKRILEMAKDICRVKLNCNDVCNPISACDALKYAERAVEAGYSKQEWISVDKRLPEDVYGRDRKIITVLVCTKSGRVSTASRVRMMRGNVVTMQYEYTDIFEWSGLIAKKVTHWMPLPEAPKGGTE